MRAEYNLSDGVRGKHSESYQQEHTVTIHQKDGITIVQNFKLEEGAVILEPDVREQCLTNIDFHCANNSQEN